MVCDGIALTQRALFLDPVDNFGTVVGENPTPYGCLALMGCQWTVNCLLGFALLIFLQHKCHAPNFPNLHAISTQGNTLPR